jgi:hypothetical protein
MNRAPPRTGKTPLADAELYLFDALFNVTDRVGALRREGFATLNLPYNHDLDPPELDALVLRLAGAGLLCLRRASRRPDLGARVTLTPAGGRLWELERVPNWARFIRDSASPEEPSGTWVLRIRASRVSVAEAFLETARACGLYAPVMPRLSRRRLRARVVPWKPPESLIELRVPLRSADCPPGVLDWAQYEAGRSWWRSIPELTTLSDRGARGAAPHQP